MPDVQQPIHEMGSQFLKHGVMFPVARVVKLFRIRLRLALTIVVDFIASLLPLMRSQSEWTQCHSSVMMQHPLLRPLQQCTLVEERQMWCESIIALSLRMPLLSPFFSCLVCNFALGQSVIRRAKGQLNDLTGHFWV